jgi:magnesium transporter
MTGIEDRPARSLEELVESGDLPSLDAWLGERTSVEVAEELARLDRSRRGIPFRLLGKDRALEVFELLDPALQQELLEGLRDANVVQIFHALDPDDRARLTEDLPAKVAKRLLAGLSPHERRLTATLLGYPEDSAGRIMSPEVANLRASMTAADAIERLRRIGHTAETIYALPVTDDQRRLVGALGLRDLVLAPPDALVGDLMDPDVYSVPADVDQEQAARLIREADLLALPVVDAENRLIGVVTVDDAMEILEEEDTEDVARAGGSEPLGRPYLTVSVLAIARSRVIWLLALIVAASLTVNVLHLFEATLDRVVQLALFIPLVIGTGGNTGSQAATTVTRAIAVGEVRLSDLGRIIVREVRVGALLGSILGVLSVLPVWVLFGADIALVVGLTMVSICTLATLIGSMLPLLAMRLGTDPAVMSAPFITTLVDASGLLLYFLIARLVLGI